MKTKIVVSRKWHNPEIELFVDQQEVGAKMDLEEFINAVTAEVGSPAMMMTKTQLTKAIHDAVFNVVTEMKKQTIHVV